MAAAARCRSLALTLLLAFSVVVAAAAADDGEAALKHLHFYFHEIDAGAPNATVANVASLHRNGSKLGDVAVFDCPLREGPDPASRLIGRGRPSACTHRWTAPPPPRPSSSSSPPASTPAARWRRRACTTPRVGPRSAASWAAPVRVAQRNPAQPAVHTSRCLTGLGPQSPTTTKASGLTQPKRLAL
ncbi:hypothetical protein HU200_013129 [Digitaria exilis]|uniref:Dirigent protein n=1 Tax=Digitaria exilis TaxID=1010633 RepID=A0A835FF34_9POAL|nr:hypothetical protein HU200_013129 [Digitaria exilis]